jgi:hypothetical protein
MRPPDLTGPRTQGRNRPLPPIAHAPRPLGRRAGEIAEHFAEVGGDDLDVGWIEQ